MGVLFSRLSPETNSITLWQCKLRKTAKNLVLDVKFAAGISDPAGLEAAINNLPGVLENGLFVNITDQVLVGEIVDGEPRVRDLVKA